MNQIALNEKPEVVLYLFPGTPASNPPASPIESTSSSPIAYIYPRNIVYIFLSPRPDHHQLCQSVFSRETEAIGFMKVVQKTI